MKVTQRERGTERKLSHTHTADQTATIIMHGLGKHGRGKGCVCGHGILMLLLILLPFFHDYHDYIYPLFFQDGVTVNHCLLPWAFSGFRTRAVWVFQVIKGRGARVGASLKIRNDGLDWSEPTQLIIIITTTPSIHSLLFFCFFKILSPCNANFLNCCYYYPCFNCFKFINIGIS